MKKIKDFLKVNKYAAIWTICYIVVMFIVLLGLFDFNMFSGPQWRHLFRAQLNGFAGFVFGLLILAAVPMYIATTLVIVRTKKPLITIKLKKEVKKDAAAEKKQDSTPVAEPEFVLPSDMPSELKGAFIRAKHNLGARPQTSVFNKQESDIPTEKEPVPVAADNAPVGLPIPDSFDFSGDTDGSSSDSVPSFKPVFTDFNFSDDPAPDSKSPLLEYMNNHKIDYTVDGDVILARDMAIATHDDSDFWIADNDNWFAAGKQKESPIAVATAAATEHDVKPAIYLAEKNIMDIDGRIAEWKSNGIIIIQELSEII